MTGDVDFLLLSRLLSALGRQKTINWMLDVGLNSDRGDLRILIDARFVYVGLATWNENSNVKKEQELKELGDDAS